MKRSFLALCGILILSSFSMDKPAWKLFDKTGKECNYQNLLDEASKADVILFGELHDNAISHWLQYELLSDLYNKNRGQVILGAEMFETDNQLLLNELIEGQISLKNFEAEAKLWPNYSTDYKPLVEFALEHHISFIGTNIPRRYAASVNRKGFEALDSLSDQAKSLIAPLPISYDSALPSYKAMMNMGGHVGANLPKAQAIKDATMAWNILKYKPQESIFLHFNGAYHSDNFEGIVWYLKKYNPHLNILTITTVEQDKMDSLQQENIGKANFIILVPQSMTKTH